MKRTAGCSHNTLPIADELPVKTLSTPFGTPAFSASAASASALNGVSLAGLITTVQPAASAGDTLRVIIEDGKFHGVIAPQTPIGCLIASGRAAGTDPSGGRAAMMRGVLKCAQQRSGTWRCSSDFLRFDADYRLKQSTMHRAQKRRRFKHF